MDALVRIRVLRRDGYRCKARSGYTTCGQPAPHVGTVDGEAVALCPAHVQVN